MLTAPSPDQSGGALEALATLPLTHLRPGESGVVAQIEGGRGVRERLAVQGLVQGVPVRMMQRAGRGHGGVVILRGDTRLALGKGEAAKVLVTPVPSGREHDVGSA